MLKIVKRLKKYIFKDIYQYIDDRFEKNNQQYLEIETKYTRIEDDISKYEEQIEKLNVQLQQFISSVNSFEDRFFIEAQKSNEAINELYTELKKQNQAISESSFEISEHKKEIATILGEVRNNNNAIVSNADYLQQHHKNIVDIYNILTEKHNMILSIKDDIKEIIRREIIGYYSDRDLDEAESQVIDFLKQYKLQMIPYKWTFEYYDTIAKVYWDDSGFPYVLRKGKKLFFPKSFTEKKIQYYYGHLLAEQDSRSPHLYFDKTFSVEGKCFDEWIDVGAAEGIITLDHIDSFTHAYLIETDSSWVEALKRTFEPYKDCIDIIEGYAGSCNDQVQIKDLIKNSCLCMIKIDVEGDETNVLNGMNYEELCEGSMVAVCTYHNQLDASFIYDFFSSKNYNMSFSKGYILSDWGRYEESYLRKGVLRVKKVK